MNKVITMTLYRRPKYTAEMFSALAKCVGVGDYLLHIYLEPGCDEVFDIANLFSAAKEVNIVRNEKVLGNLRNTIAALVHGFSVSDYVIHLEDDTVPAVDFLELMEWAGREYVNDVSVFSVNGYSRRSRELYRPELNNVVERVNNKVIPWGWATWQDRWREVISHPELTTLPDHWGLSTFINEYVVVGRDAIRPLIARIQNIGAEMSAHVPNAEWHAANHYNEFGIWSVPYRSSGEYHELVA